MVKVNNSDELNLSEGGSDSRHKYLLPSRDNCELMKWGFRVLCVCVVEGCVRQRASCTRQHGSNMDLTAFSPHKPFPA